MANMFDPKNYKPKAGNIPVGIHSGIEFTSVVKQDGWLDVTVTDPLTKNSLRKRLFYPSGKVFDNETPQEAREREETRFLGYLFGLLSLFISEEDYAKLVSTPTFDKAVEYVIKQLTPHLGKKLNIKVVPTKTLEFSELPSYIGALEAHVEGEEPTLMYSKVEEALVAKYFAKKTKIADKSENSDLPF